MTRGELQNEGVISKFERKFNVKRKGTKVVHEEVRQRLVATGRIDYLNQTKGQCSTNWKEDKEKV